jgi:outer membrane protein assembly factor BamB
VPQYFFGYGPSPFVWRDRLIVTVGGKAGAGGRRGTAVAAFDTATGRVLWETEDAWGADYASPLVARLHGRDVVLALLGGESRPSAGGLLVLDPLSGTVLDRFPWRARTYESASAATPLVLDDRRILVSECYEKGAALLAFDPAFASSPAWTQRGFGLHWMTPLHLDGHLYGFAGRNPPDTEFKCVDAATGRVVWSDDTRFTADGRTQSFFRGSLLRADRRVFALGEDGLFGEFELSPRGLVVRQRTRLFSAPSAWTLPALHRGLLYVSQNERDPRSGVSRRLICFDLRGPR